MVNLSHTEMNIKNIVNFAAKYSICALVTENALNINVNIVLIIGTFGIYS